MSPLKVVVSLIAIFFLFVAIWIGLRTTHYLDTYSVPTPSMEPTIRVGEGIIATRFKKPKRGDVIAYQREGTTYLHRLMGVGGDLIEMRDGYCYVNGKMFEEEHELKFNHVVSKNDFEKLKEFMSLSLEEVVEAGSDSVIAQISNEQFHKLFQGRGKRLVSAKGVADPYVQVFKQTPQNKWNVDNWGPFQIPENHLFLLGDNRHNSMDSRYFGLVKEDDWLSTFVSKYQPL